MKLTEALDRTGILLTREESKRLKEHKEDDRPLDGWLYIFDNLGILDKTGISAPALL